MSGEWGVGDQNERLRRCCLSLQLLQLVALCWAVLVVVVRVWRMMESTLNRSRLELDAFQRCTATR